MTHAVTPGLGIERTAAIEKALAEGTELGNVCPIGCLRPSVDVTGQQELDVVIWTFWPCGHQGFPQWDASQRTPSRYLSSPISRPRPAR